MRIRVAQPADFAQILALNEESVRFLSALSQNRLAHLHKEAAYHRVLESDDGIDAFLLAFRETAAYDSPNFLWFAARFPEFLYIDRVVVSASKQGLGIGKLFYEDLLIYASNSGTTLVTCELDIEPPNRASQRFHAAFGFREIGTQFVGPTSKRVSLQVVSVQPNDGSTRSKE